MGRHSALFPDDRRVDSAEPDTGMLRMMRVRSGVLQLVAVVMAVVAMCLPARAHPHVWVTVETTLVYENGAFVGVAHKWTFDDMYTAMAIEGLDKNKDGKYDRAELEELTKVNMQGLKEFGYFTHAALGGEALKLGEARDYWQEHKDGVLSLHFTVPFATPVLAEAKGLTYSVYDPTYFIDFSLAKANGARLGQGAPKDCALIVGVSQGDNALGDSFGAMGGMIVIAKTVALACGPEALAAAAAPPKPSADAATPPPPKAQAASGPMQRMFAWVRDQQEAAHTALKTSVERLKSESPWSAALFLAGISLLYGVLHAAGPGHGKAVISSYVLADGRTVRRGVILSFLAAGVQALSAVVLVGVLIVALRWTGLQSKAMEAWLETVSWALVALIGAWLVYYQLRGGHAHAHAHAHSHAHGAGHGHEQHHHHHQGQGQHHQHHGHNHHHHQGHHHHGDACEVCGHMPAPSQLQGDWSWAHALSIAFAIGIRPCTGAVLVLVFAIGQGLWWAGVLSTFVMAIGTAAAVSVLAACAVGFREASARIAGKGSSKWGERVQLAAGLGGAGLVLVMGVVFFIGSLVTTQPF
jgi:nickel/cobalt transporter (NicO) family protein